MWAHRTNYSQCCYRKELDPWDSTVGGTWGLAEAFPEEVTLNWHMRHRGALPGKATMGENILSTQTTSASVWSWGLLYRSKGVMLTAHLLPRGTLSLAVLTLRPLGDPCLWTQFHFLGNTRDFLRYLGVSKSNLCLHIYRYIPSLMWIQSKMKH